MYRHQQGLSGVVVIIMLAISIFFVILGFKVVPVFTEYLGVKKMIQQLVTEQANSSPREIKDAFSRKLAIEYVGAITADDLVILRENGALSISAKYDKPVRLFGEDVGTRADLVFHFEIQEGKRALDGAKVGE